LLHFNCCTNINKIIEYLFQENCINHCVNKFSNVNQKFLGTYVEIQQQINAKRQIEFEAQHEQQLLQQKAQETAAAAAQLIDPLSDPASLSEGLKVTA
jgi:hypothetical protein